ncbi:protein terminal ear1 [Beta vulgaris subsp. vulgaris]|uniref:protein terminal ear1 n=1 Tax=Beta vulgaris subsp. vulgaris TaxID=3555 RepID=UPI002037670F|nr:protein terminal ear1 [Beta vulgaris subsp. vulgaris]
MSENGVVRFAGNLDPSAQEFRPTYPPQAHHHQHNQYPFLSPPPPPPPLPPFFTDVIYTPPPLTSSYHVSLPPTTSFIPPSIPPAACSPTRGLLLTAAPSDVSESLVRRDLEIFGDVRAVQMGRVSEGILTVHFYDLRAAHAALNAVREQHMQHQNRLRIYYSSILAPMQNHNPPNPPPAPGLIAGRPLWAQFTIPSTTAFPDGHNQGTLVIFNLNPNVSAHHLRDIFQVFGAIKELRETPMKRQQRFVEFYDVRDASRALTEMNGKEINGRTVMIEYSRPGGHSNKKFNHSHHFNLHTNNNFHHHHITKPHPSPPPPPQFSMRHYRRTSPRQGTIRRRRNSPCSEESLEAAMTGLSLLPSSNDGRNEDRKIVARKNGNHNNGNNNAANGNCSSSGSSSSASAKQQQTTTKVKPWRGKHKNSDPRFLIKEDAIVEAGNDKDTRSTVMIKNIPNKYSQKLLLNMLDNHCIHCNEQIADAGDDQPLSSYDFVYLPIDFNNKCNVGYGFVNMTSPEATLRLYKSFHHQHWEVFNSRKICEVTYARVQGLEALKEHFKNSKFACENDEYLPVVFSPPRDGRHLPAPLPIVFSNTTLHLNHDSTDVDASDFTSSTTCASTSTTTLTLHSDDFDHHHTNGGDHIYTNSTIQEGDLNDDDDDDDSSSSNGGGGVVSAEYDVISNSSIGCSSS